MGLIRLGELRLPDDGGATAIEFACIAGVLAVMALGIIDFGRAFWYRMEVQNAAQAGADWAQYKAFNCNIASQCTLGVPNGLTSTVDSATGLTPSSITVSASGNTINGSIGACGCPAGTGTTPSGIVSTACGTPCPNGYGAASGFATVTVTYNFTPIFPWQAFGGGPIALSGSATSLCFGGTTC
jgi:Flp pilus assembly protein TadG